MRKLIILLMLFVFVSSNAQKYSVQSVDSITYSYYINGSWDSLISVCRDVYKTTDIDFKYLRQRLGYAYFMKQNYALSRWHYERSLQFDATDSTSVYYLYLNGLYSGDDNYARYYASKLDRKTQQTLKLHPFRLVNMADAEYNFKPANQLYQRSATNYYRLGLGSQPGYRLSVYQSVFSYQQTYYSVIDVKQTGYYALLNYNFGGNLNASAAIHLLNTNVDDTLKYKSTLLLARLAYSRHRFDVSLTASVFNTPQNSNGQFTLHGGVLIPELKQLYLYTDISRLQFTNNTGHWVNKFGAGFVPLRKTWLEAFVVTGNQLNFNDVNGLYIYNSSDYVSSKYGGSLYYYLNKHITLNASYIFENRTAAGYTTANTYFQHSITGGIIWKF